MSKYNILKKISSKYILSSIFSYFNYKTKLKIVKYSKQYQSKFGINIFSYQRIFVFKNIYKRLQKEKGKDEITLYYDTIYPHKISILYVLSKNNINKNIKKDLLNSFFSDIYTEYSKNIYVIYEIVKEPIQLEDFKNLITINNPIKIIY